MIRFRTYLIGDKKVSELTEGMEIYISKNSIVDAIILKTEKETEYISIRRTKDFEKDILLSPDFFANPEENIDAFIDYLLSYSWEVPFCEETKEYVSYLLKELNIRGNNNENISNQRRVLTMWKRTFTN